MTTRRFSVALGVCALVAIGATASARSQPPQSAETILWNFAGAPDGADPIAGLIADASGALYGTTELGGKYARGHSAGYGTIFKLTPSGSGYTEQVLWSFGNARDGSLPKAGLVADCSGTMYGTTFAGGTHGKGTAFKFGASGEQVIWSFGGGRDGSEPSAGLFADCSGALYGTTAFGGTHSGGTVFRLTPSGSGYAEHVVWNFGATTKAGQADGSVPFAGLVADATGALYGTTYYGGQSGSGVAFKLTPSSSRYTESILWNFAGGKRDGSYPDAGLTLGASGKIYGTTQLGGRPEGGTAFELIPSGSTYIERLLWRFGGRDDGGRPFDGLTAGANGTMYGTISLGARYKNGISGSVFALTRGKFHRGAEQILWTFGTGKDGYGPAAGVIVDNSGALYGTTCCGGAHRHGIVYKIVP